MRRALLSPVPTGGDGGGGAPVGGSVRRLQMPQVLAVSTRPPLAAGPSETAAASPASGASTPTALGERTVGRAQDDGDSSDGDEPMIPLAQRAKPPVPVSPASKAMTRKDGSVQVAVRVRPLLPKEVAARVRTCVETEANTIHVPSNDKTFTFDHVFPMEADQKDLYEQVVQPLMDSFLQGYNVTVLAYGQTGSGKTYTMGNGSSAAALAPRLFQRVQLEQSENDDPAVANEVDDHEGVIPRFINEMFTRLEDDKETTTSQVSVSFLEIYGEEIHDLLDQSRGRPKDSLQVRESNGSVWVQGLTEVKVSSFTEASEQMRQGCVRRITGSTGMNEHSSRSHAVYTVKIVRKTKKTSANQASSDEKGLVPPAKRRGSQRFSSTHRPHDLLDDDDSETTIVSKLTFVDLAGSERLKKTQAEGDRMKEGIQINVGLLALGNVITALGDERRRSNPRQHVAYRDSKLTRLLQDALGGNSRTLFIACISPAESNAGETVNTLQYASRAKNIQNKAVKNVDPRSAELTRSKVLNDVLRNALTKALSLVTGYPDTLTLNANTMIGDPTVAEYLRKLEEIAWSIASGSAANSEAIMETSKAIAALIARRSSVAPGNIPSVASQESSSPRRSGVASESMTSLMESFGSETGSSVHLDESLGNPGSSINLRQLSRVVEVVSLALEMQELEGTLSEAKTTFDAAATRLDSDLVWKNALIQAKEDAVQKMSTWSMPGKSVSRFADRYESYSHAAERLQKLKHEAASISLEKALETNKFAEISGEIARDLEQKQTMIQQLRQSDDFTGVVESPSPLDLMLQVSELKNRFRLQELCDVAWALEEDERASCEKLDDQPDVLAFTAKFFPNKKCAQSEYVFGEIFRHIESAIAEEDLHSSQCKKLRERASILQRIMSGWARDSSATTEEEFLAVNEQELRTCEENIREISAALRHRRRSTAAIGISIDSVDSLDLAKLVIKRLVDVLYGHKRIVLARARSDSTFGEDTQPGSQNDALSKVKKQYEEELAAIRRKFASDLAEAYEMVKPFALKSIDDETESLYAQREADVKAIAQLEEQAKLKNDEIERMRGKMEELHNQVESMNSQFAQLKEFATVREECAQLSKELGLPAEDYAGIAAMINPLAIKEAREIRETLLAKKAAKMEEIEVAYGRVKGLEAVLKLSERFNIDLVRSSHERALDDQLLAISFHHSKLVDELSHRIESQTRVLESISGLSAELEATSVEDLRHARDNLCADDLQKAMDMLCIHETLRQMRASSDLAISTSELRIQETSLSNALSAEALERNGRVLKALLFEKANRLAEVEKVANEVRSLIEVMALSESDLKSTLSSEYQKINGVTCSANGAVEELQSILRKAGQLDTSRRALDRLTAIREILLEVRDGRLNSISYAYSVLEEAKKIANESLLSSGFQAVFAPASSDGNQADIKDYGCSREALRFAVEELKAMSEPIDGDIRTILLDFIDQLRAHGIETTVQQMSFFLGSKDTAENPKRKLLERFIVESSDEDVSTDRSETDHSHAGCYLSKLDPDYTDFARYFSVSFGTKRLTELGQAGDEIRQISEIVMSARTRLQSLQKINSDYNALGVMEKAIKEFNANASSKDRLFGSSTVLMKEEKQRKRYARDYPLKVAALRREVQKWVENESGDYNLDILGDSMKQHILRMLNINTDLIHLDLSMLDPSRPSARRSSKTAAGISVATVPLVPGANTQQPGPTNQESSSTATPRVRPRSALARDASVKKRTGAN